MGSKQPWIVIPNWDKFQHYKDRNPSWIKLYTELNSRDEWLQLTYAERGLLVTIWCEYARADGQLRADLLPRYVQARARIKQLESLNHAGFIQLADSKPLALTRARALARAVKRESIKSARTRTRPQTQTTGDAKQNAGAYTKHQPNPEPVDAVDPEIALELVRRLADRYAQ